MKTIDLHVHSNISDGSFTPSQVTELAFHAGLAAYALTDHDCTDGYREAAACAEQLNRTAHNHNADSVLTSGSKMLEVIPAVEISAGYNGRDIHILGYYIDPDNQELNEALALTRKRRYGRNIEMIQRFRNKGIDISYEELTYGNPNTIITRGHFSRLLIEKGYAGNREESFSKYLNPDTEFYVPREYIDIRETVRLIYGAGGLPFLAHPLLYKLSGDGVAKLVSDFKENGGAGIEAIYSSNSPDDERFVRALAEKNGLLISGGSDFHGASKPDLAIGVGRGNMAIPYEILETIKKSGNVPERKKEN